MKNDDILLNVISEYSDGDSAASIARKYGVSTSWVMSIIRKVKENRLNDILKDSGITDEEKLRFESNISKRLDFLSNRVVKHSDDTVWKALCLYSKYVSYKDIENETGMSHASLLSWIKRLTNEELTFTIDGIEKSANEINVLKEDVIARKQNRNDYDISYKLQVILEFIKTESATKTAEKYRVDNSSVLAWSKQFIAFPGTYKHLLNSENIKKYVACLRTLLEENQNIKYEVDFKYKVIEQLINQEKNVTELADELHMGKSTIRTWVRKFAEYGYLEGTSLKYTPEKLAFLQEQAKFFVKYNQHNVDEKNPLAWAIEIDSELCEWKHLADEWLSKQHRNKSACVTAMSKFFKEYLIALNIPRAVKEFLSSNEVPDYYEIMYSKHTDKGSAYTNASKIIAFIDWILYEYYSVEDDFGQKRIPYEYHNPLVNYLPDYVYRNKKNESSKNILPYAYIEKLRDLICPKAATTFKDWCNVQAFTGGKSNSGDWCIVDDEIIDTNDPDCVYRKRRTSKHEREKYGYSEEVTELWFPGTAVAILIKLLLPLRTYQVRMLDSGEMDTFKYNQRERSSTGYWEPNDSILAKGTARRENKKGVFRKFVDPITHHEFTGFYINTNKTADINKDEAEKGYEIPWQYEEALFWLVKLRDWQCKYNPIINPTKWTSLSKRHFGAVKSNKVLQEMGEITFLFRNPYDKENNGFPLTASSMERMWYKLLELLEKNENHQFEFVDKNSYITTYYPLHSLRVSLITAYAIDGGVPMPILQKCIAGHARLIMTLYYTKMGVTYVTDTMTKAERRLIEKEEETLCRFVREAEYKQLVNNTVSVDEIAYQAVVNAQKSGASIVMNDKGICPQGCMGCNIGGTEITDESGVTKYVSVPGYPESNCVQCRWFITGPAFLPGLVNYFNIIGYKISEESKNIQSYQQKVDELEDEKYRTELRNELFSGSAEVIRTKQLLADALKRSDKLANDYNATLRLIDKCQVLLHLQNNEVSSDLQLVTVGSRKDIQLELNIANSEIEQLQIICNGAEIYPEADAGKAVLKRSQLLDIAFKRNGFEPVMFSLSENEQLIAGNQFMRLLINRAGSFNNAIPYAEGRQKLKNLGLTERDIMNISSLDYEKMLIIDDKDNIKKGE